MEGCEVHSGAVGKRPNKAGVRQTNTRRVGPVWPNADGSCLDVRPARSSSTSLTLNQTSLGRVSQLTGKRPRNQSFHGIVPAGTRFESAFMASMMKMVATTTTVDMAAARVV